VADPTIAVVGAGTSGLLVSWLLAASSARVVVVERLPAVGGQEPGPEVPEHAERVRAAGIRCLLGTVATSWDGAELQTLGVRGGERLKVDALVVATGTRPATRAELGITGDRFAGVLPASAALHITESGVLLGHRPVIVGAGSLAVSCLHAVRHAGAERVTIVAPDGIHDGHAAEADQLLDGWEVTAAHGNPRVQSVTVRRDGASERLATDAVLLAHRRVPMRNIEGAIAGGDRVVFCQPTEDPKSLAEVRVSAEDAARKALGVAALPQGGT
jgi:pyruvate/2-oxoglutarate dehydrogenase complex dihydrolipoamide dehydrogenase (E3) component